jgi:cytochrome c553
LSIKLSHSVAVCLLLLLLSAGLHAQTPAEQARAEVEAAIHLTPDVERGKKAFMVCAVCHRPEGWGFEDGTYPQIAGQLPAVIIKQLADIRARNRDNPTMLPFTSPQLLGGVQEIADVAAYISQLPMDPMNGVGPGVDLAWGEQVYRENCVDCHGDRGQGDATDHIPLIYGQHYRYLYRQFEWIKMGKRRNSDQKMVKQIQRFSPRDISAVLDYVSRLRPPAEKLAQPGWQNPDFPNYSRAPIPAPPRRW